MKYVRASELPARLRFLRWLGRQTWLPKGQDRLLRAFVNPDSCAPFLFEVDFFGQTYRGDLAHYIDWMVFCYGSAATSELSLLKEIASQIRIERRTPIRFVDVGANAGHHTLFMAQIVDEILAFEPFPPLLHLIEEKIALNGLKNVRILPFALGDKEETLNYYPGERANSGVGTFLPDEEERKAKPIRLPIKKGDSLLDGQNFGRIDIMKVDVEGFEPYVFSGLQNRIRIDRPVILTEMTEESRKGFGNEGAFRNTLYQNAQLASVTGRNGRVFKLRPFVYEKSKEVLIVPPEMQSFIEARGGF
jgi:FkbM family methyltransferase